MQVKIIKYSKSSTGQPVKDTEYDITTAMVFDEEPVIEETIELNRFFEFGVPSMDLTLDKDKLSNEVKNLFTTESLKNNITGINYEDGNIKFKGYINEESVEYDEITEDYLITAINWWKYFYDEMANHYCPDISDITPVIYTDYISIKSWLEKVFIGDIITEIIVDIDEEWDPFQPYPMIWLSNYTKYAPLMTIQKMLDNLHKVLLGVFIVEDTKLIFTQMHRTENAVTDITKLIENNSYTKQSYYPVDYNSVLYFAFGDNWLRYKENSVIKTYPVEDINKIEEQYNYLDLRQNVAVMEDTDIAFLSINVPEYGGKVISVTNEIELKEKWVGSAISTTIPAGDKLAKVIGLIIDIDNDTKTITIDRWSNTIAPYQELPFGNYGAYIYDIERRFVQYNPTEEKSEEIIKAGIIEKISEDEYKYHFYQTDKMFYRIWDIKGRTFCTIDTINITILDIVSIYDIKYKIMSARKNIYAKSTEIEIEEYTEATE